MHKYDCVYDYARVCGLTYAHSDVYAMYSMEVLSRSPIEQPKL